MDPVCVCEPETFLSLLRNKAHWQFELFLILLVDGVILGLAWPWLQKMKKHLRKYNGH